jgi:hypothetical protein
MPEVLSAGWFASSMFVGMLASFALGIRFRKLIRETDTSIGAIDAAIYSLFALLVAFTFSGAASRFDNHRKLIGEEASGIGTAYLRLDLLPPAAQPTARKLVRNYLDARLEVYRKFSGTEAARRQLEICNRIQLEIWQTLVPATALPGAHPNAGMLLLDSINEMFDVADKRRMAILVHPPREVMYLLFGVGLICAFLIGKATQADGVGGAFHGVGYALITATVVFYIVDLEYPRRGWIRADRYDQVLIELRATMNDGR